MLSHYRGKRLTIVRSHQRGQTRRNSWMEAFSYTSTSDPCELCVRPTTDAHRAISLEMCLVERWLCGAPSWLSTNSSTCVTLSSVRAVLGRPLPTRRSVLPVSRSFRNTVSKPDLVQFFSGNSASNLRERYPFNRCKFLLLVNALSSTLNTIFE